MQDDERPVASKQVAGRDGDLQRRRVGPLGRMKAGGSRDEAGLKRLLVGQIADTLPGEKVGGQFAGGANQLGQPLERDRVGHRVHHQHQHRRDFAGRRDGSQAPHKRRSVRGPALTTTLSGIEDNRLSGGRRAIDGADHVACQRRLSPFAMRGCDGNFHVEDGGRLGELPELPACRPGEIDQIANEVRDEFLCRRCRSGPLFQSGEELLDPDERCLGRSRRHGLTRRGKNVLRSRVRFTAEPPTRHFAGVGLVFASLWVISPDRSRHFPRLDKLRRVYRWCGAGAGLRPNRGTALGEVSRLPLQWQVRFPVLWLGED